MDAYNFDEVIDRKGTNCLKYDFAVERGYPEGVLPFWVADMDFRTAPPVIEELERRVQHGIFGYTDPGADYRAAVWNWMKTQHDWTPAVGSLTITPGVVFALGMAVQSFTAPGDAVLIQQPVYYPFSSIILGNDRQLVNSPLVLKDGHYEIDFVDFEQKITSKNVKLFLLCNPHNPAGRVYTRDELQKMATICLQHGVTIVADEIHNDFIRKGYEHTVLASLGNDIAQHVVTCTAPSKTFNLAGLQISNIFIENESMRQKFRATIDHAGYSQPNALGMFAAQAAYVARSSAGLSRAELPEDESVPRTASAESNAHRARRHVPALARLPRLRPFGQGARSSHRPRSEPLARQRPHLRQGRRRLRTPQHRLPVGDARTGAETAREDIQKQIKEAASTDAISRKPLLFLWENFCYHKESG